MIWVKMNANKGLRRPQYSRVGQSGAAHFHAEGWDQPTTLWAMRVSESDIRQDYHVQHSLWRFRPTGNFLRDFLRFAGEEHPGGRVH